MEQLMLVAVGGAMGAMARYGIGIWLAREEEDVFPLPTLLVNLVGCLLIGVAWALVEQGHLASRGRMLLIVGVLGGFTTFSTFGWETIKLLDAQRHGLAASYVLSSLLGGVFLAWIGWFGTGKVV